MPEFAGLICRRDAVPNVSPLTPTIWLARRYTLMRRDFWRGWFSMKPIISMASLFIDRLGTAGEMEVRDTLREFEIQFASQQNIKNCLRSDNEAADWKNWRNYGRSLQYDGISNAGNDRTATCNDGWVTPDHDGHWSVRRAHVRGSAKFRHQVLGLVTRPDRPAHRRENHRLIRCAIRRSVPEVEVFEPESINSPEAHAWMQEAADLFVVCDYGADLVV